MNPNGNTSQSIVPIRDIVSNGNQHWLISVNFCIGSGKQEYLRLPRTRACVSTSPRIGANASTRVGTCVSTSARVGTSARTRVSAKGG